MAPRRGRGVVGMVFRRTLLIDAQASISVPSTETRSWLSSARSRFSGGIDGRPAFEYSRSNAGDKTSRTSSTTARIDRSGWSKGTRASPRITLSNRSLHRIRDSWPPTLCEEYFRSLLAPLT